VPNSCHNNDVTFVALSVCTLKELGPDASDEQLGYDKGKRVTDADLQAIADAVLEINREARIKLQELTLVSGNVVMPTLSIKLSVDNSED